MDNKGKLLALLSENKNGYVSGAEIAKVLGVSRTAVWKTVGALKDEGSHIEAVTNKGYHLVTKADTLNKDEIESVLCGTAKDVNVIVKKEVASTNDTLKELAKEGARDKSVLCASAQSGGKGRYDRKFVSPENSGIYFSILLRPKMSAEKCQMLTALAAVAVAEGIEKVSDKKCGIKWVNDVTIESKKVCGILSEAAFSIENNAIDYVVVGIGINLSVPKGGWDESIKNTATTVWEDGETTKRNELLGEVLNSFFAYYDGFGKDGKCEGFAERYKARCTSIGRDVKVVRQNDFEHARCAKTLGLDDALRLRVEYENGEIETLNSGEISLR